MQPKTIKNRKLMRLIISPPRAVFHLSQSKKGRLTGFCTGVTASECFGQLYSVELLVT
jgi:hypothetical protein